MLTRVIQAKLSFVLPLVEARQFAGFDDKVAFWCATEVGTLLEFWDNHVGQSFAVMAGAGDLPEIGQDGHFWNSRDALTGCHGHAVP